MRHRITEEFVELVRKYVVEGYSVADIATLVGDGHNRNSITGVIWRNGLRGKPQGKRKQPTKKLGPRKKRFTYNIKDRSEADRLPPQKPIVWGSDLEIPLTQRKSLIELNHKHCRWPVNDPTTADFFYCGAVVSDGSVYCECHSRRAYKPSHKRKPGGAGGSQAKIHARKEDAVAIS